MGKSFKGTNFQGNSISNVGDPTSGVEVGDRDYNDSRYVSSVNDDTVEGLLTITRGRLQLQTATGSTTTSLFYYHDDGIRRARSYWQESDGMYRIEVYDSLGNIVGTRLRFDGNELYYGTSTNQVYHHDGNIKTEVNIGDGVATTFNIPHPYGRSARYIIRSTSSADEFKVKASFNLDSLELGPFAVPPTTDQYQVTIWR